MKIINDTISGVEKIIYDDVCCDKYGMFVCSFDVNHNIAEINVGSDIKLETEGIGENRIWNEISSSYENPISFKIDFCKYTGDEMSSLEIRAISRWLQQMKLGYRKFQFVHIKFYDILFYAKCISLKKLSLNGKTYGYRATFQTNSPYAVTKDINTVIDMNSSTVKFDLYDSNDEIMYTLPSLKIEIKEDCDFSIYNAFADKTMKIDGCIAGEIIRINSDTGYITSSIRNVDIMNSFNGVWFKIGNTYSKQINKLTINGMAKIIITTRFSRKVGV